ncbi:MAG: alpha-2-macroglobulin family protein [Chloroherpetonaceae bacterium]|nr:alpha-2-macroglobulin family protein [Chloroherpetonaceae bacterium]
MTMSDLAQFCALCFKFIHHFKRFTLYCQNYAFLFAILTIILITGCKKEDTPENKIPFESGRLGSFETAEESDISFLFLKVEFVSPTGETESEAVNEVSILFNQPMVEINEETQNPQKNTLLKFTPEIPGTIRWLGSRTILFTPADTLPPSTTYEVAIPKSISSLNGKQFEDKADYKFSFSTPRQRIVECQPSGRWEKLDFDDEIFLRFRFKADESVKKLISLTNSKSEQLTYTLKFLTNEEKKKKIESFEKLEKYNEIYLLNSTPTERIAILTITSKLSPSEQVTLQLKDGASSSVHTLNFREEFYYKGEKEFSIPAGTYPDLQFSTPVSNLDLRRLISITPFADTLSIESSGYNTTYHYLYRRFKPNTKYVVRLGKELVDKYGQNLKEQAEIIVNVGDYEPYFMMPDGVGLMETEFPNADSSVFPGLSLVGMNIPSLTLRYREVSSSEIVQFYSSQNSNDYWSSRNLRSLAASGMKEYKVQIPNTKNTEFRKKWDLRQALSPDRKSGFVLVETAIPFNQNQNYLNKIALVHLTSLGVTAKFGMNNARVLVTKLSNAQPLPNADVRIYSYGKKVWEGKTNSDGVALAGNLYSNEIAFHHANGDYGKKGIVIVTEYNGETSVISSDDNGIERWRFGIADYNTDRNNERVELFTERGIYRAGEKVFFKGIARRYGLRGWENLTTPIELQVRDARDEVIFKKTYSPDKKYGAFADSLSLSTSAKLGYYSISLRNAKNEYLSSGSFQVEAFKPATFTAKVIPSERSIVRGSPLKAVIEGRYLFGAPMSKSTYRWNLNRAVLPSLSITGFDGYFWQPLGWSSEYVDRNYNLGQGEGTLSAEGEATLSLKTDFETTEPALLTLETEITSNTRQTISERASVIFHPAEFYIGLKPQTTFASENYELPIEIVTATPEGKAVKSNVKVELVRRQWISVKRAGVGGRYEWESQQVDSTIKTITVSTSESGASSQKLKLEGSGIFFIRASATDSRGNITRSETYCYAYGASYVAWEREDHDRIELVTNKKEFKPGETAKILVQSPFDTATALITVEREGIFDHRVQTLTSTSGAIEIPIKEDYLPNVYVSVALLKGRVSYPKKGENDFGKPQFRLGYTKLSVIKDSRQLKVRITPQKKNFHTKETVEAEVFVTDQNGSPVQAEVTLAAVDAGVLNLIGYTFPNLFEAFYQERGLGVIGTESRLKLIEQRNYGEKGEARGGDKGGAGIGGYAFRQNFITTAYWNPTLVTDANGKATVRFTLPDNMTTFRLMADAHSITHFGYSQTDIVVNQPLLLLASLPRFARVGDAFEAGVSVHNYTDEPMTVSLNNLTEGISSLGTKNSSITLEAGKSKEVRFAFKAEKRGTAIFRFTAESPRYRDAIQVPVPIQLPEVKEVLSVFSSTDSTITEKISIPKAILPNAGDLTVQASSSALVGLREAVMYVFDYPYGCLEQKTSKMMPYLVAESLLKEFKLQTALDTAKGGYKAELSRLMMEFEKYQVSSGGFSYWPNGEVPYDYLTAYVVYAMILAEKQGIEFKASMKSKAITYLRSVLYKNQSSYYGQSYDNVTNAFIVYALTLSGDKAYARSMANSMFENRAILPMDAKAYLIRAYAALGKGSVTQKEDSKRVEILLNEVLTLAKMESETCHFENNDQAGGVWFFSSPAKTTASVLIAAFESRSNVIPDEIVSKSVRWLLKKQKKGHWENTQDNIFVLEALNQYFTRFESLEPNFKIEFTVASQSLLSTTFKGRSIKQEVTSSSLENFAKGESLPLTIAKTGIGKLYYGARLTYFPTYQLKSVDRGISIMREIKPLVKREGFKHNEFKAGDVVQVTLTVSIPYEMNFIALSDPLPAGFEAINPRLRVNSTVMKREQEVTNNQYEEGESEYDYPIRRYGFDFSEFKDDRLTLFAETLDKGVYKYTYFCRAITYGTFSLPPSSVEQMYSPEVYGRTASSSVVIKD